MAFNISQQIDVRSKCANIDILYGPYDSIGAACTAIIPARRVIGRTVGIIDNGSILEYWWKSGLEDSDLVQKVEQLALSLHIVGESSFTREEGESIYGQFMVEGGAGVKRAMLYQVINGNEVYVQDYTNIGKGSPYTFNIPNPSMSGVYTYRIKVIDSLDNYAITGLNTNYLEYTLYYGGISTIYNLTNLNAIKVKNYASVAGQQFQINISVRDNTFRVTNVALTDSTDEHSGGLSIDLTPYIDPSTTSSTYIGNYYYYMPSESTLETFNGKKLSIVVSYMDGETARTKTQELFRLLDIGNLEIIPEYEGGNYYATLPGYYVFTLQAGVENISIVLTPGENTDFDFERSTVLAYRRFSLKVVPHNIEKNNAQIVINYFYIYNNVEYHGSFTRIIGNILPLPPQSYYEPEEGGTVSMVKLINANQDDYTGVDEGQYYKLISEQVSTTQLSSSFLLDTYCKINQQNDKTIKYITLSYGGIEIATITEDEISCVNKWRSLYTDMPINEWVQIGVGINLQESFQRNGELITGYYHCIYINGMAVKTVLIDNVNNRPLEYDGSSNLVLTVGNGILVQKCFLYYRNNGENIINPNMPQGSPSVIYNNYKSHRPDFHEPDDLPVLKFLRISNTELSDRYFNIINTYKTDPTHNEDPIKHTTQFGRIGDTKARTMAEYDPNYSSSVIESNATLFRQSVDIKKLAQKQYAVLCNVQWKDEVMQDIIVECHTQGTSTLVYSIPNFKFTFWRLINDGTAVERYNPRFIKKEGSDDYYEESIYTAKADFMDSSHLNNTPTCNYYNNLIRNLIEHNEITGSPSARNGMLDAIWGFPIVMEISDTADDFSDIFTNIGSFMLNIDKTGNSLGFEIEEGGQKLECISFEGTSNDNEHGAAGRFDIPDGVTLKDYTNTVGEVKENEIREDYQFVKDNVLKKKALDDFIEYEGQQVLVRNLPYVAWCLFLSDGLEYRYPDSDIYKEKSDLLNKVMNVDDFIALYTMWWWVYKSDTLTPSDYRDGFVQHFDLDYCMIYFINLMTYAQTDNLGKNAMFDYWVGDGKWYPRPYDLDSEAGLDNNGNDNIAPFVEIRAPFSLNYDPAKETDYAWRDSNYLIDEKVTDPVTGITYELSTIQYGAQTYDRYHFSSNKSKLWINFYKNFKEQINTFYANLRNNFGYGPESIIGLCQSVLIDKLGVAQYNQDFQNKYLANSDQRLAYGNRWYKFKKWITKRFAFCDSYFGATESAMYNITSRINYNIKVDAPQYVAQQYQGEANRETKFVLDNVSFNAGSGAATIITLLVNQPSVFETSLFKYVVLNQGSANYQNLISLDVSGNKNPQFTDITSVTGQSLDNLKYLNISNSAVQNLTVPPNVKTLLAENVNLSSLTIPDGCAVEEISLKGSTFLGEVNFSGLPNLRRLDLTECTFNQSVIFANLPQLEELIMDKAIFNGDVVISVGVHVTSFNFTNLNIHSISFSGSDLEIDTINFHNTKFGVSSINLNAITKNIRDLYFDNCQGLEHLQITDGTKFRNLNCLSLYGSSIKALGANNTIFDCSHFNNMSSLRKVYTFRSDGTVTYQNFTFRNTQIEQITNISWTGTGADLFRDCQKLTSIGGSLSLSTSADYLFYRCYLLSTLPSILINSSVTSASYIFAGANSVSYSDAEAIIRKCTNVTNFTSAFRMKQFASNEIVRISYMLANNSVVTNLSHFLSQYNGGTEFASVTNDIAIEGKIPSTVVDTTYMCYGFHSISVPYDLLSSATHLTTAPVMFAYSNVTFTGNGRPIQNDRYDVAITLSNAVNKNFFSTALVNISQMFYGSNVITNDPTLFANLTNLVNTNAMFAGSIRAFTFVNSQNETELININAINMWANNPSISDISGCFSNVYNVYCTGLNFHNSVPSTRTINISGLFGLSNSTYRSEYPITINIDAIVPNIKTDSSFAIPSNSGYDGPGVFQNRSVTITSTPVSGKILSKLNTVSKKLFNGAIVYLPSNVTEFDLSNVSTSCYGMFEGCRLYKLSNDQEHTYTVQDRKFVNVSLPTYCSNYSRMFRDSSVLASLPSLRSSGASDLSEMYRGCVINVPDLELPYNYFQICANSLSNVSSMFYNNKYLTTLGYNANRGLFEGCVNLTNVNYMFYGASFLHKGIPVNLFGTTDIPRLTSLAYMFGMTSIIYDVEDNSHKWFDSNTISPLINLDNIQYMFYRIKINSSVVDPVFRSDYGTMRDTVLDVSDERAVIDPNTFAGKILTNITRLFDHTVINPPASVGSFRFAGFTIGDDAFFSSSIANIDVEFVDTLYISSIARANRMFYQSPTGGRHDKTINNLSIFVNNLVQYPNIAKYNVAGNIDDNNIPSIYTDDNPDVDSANLFYGFGLQVPADPEASWTDYGRYNYIS